MDTTLARPARPDLDTVLQGAVDEAARLLGADGGMLYLLDRATGMLRWAFDAGIVSREDREWFRSLVLPVGKGMFGTAIEQRAVTRTDDYPSDTRFPHVPAADTVVHEVGIRSMVVAPLLSDGERLGALGVYSERPSAFDEAAVALIRALADHSASSIVNARLIEQLDRSRAELARRAEAERSLREIAARITAIRRPSEVLQRVVDESKRLLAADGAHLCTMADSRDHLVPDVVADATDDATRAWLTTMRFPVGGGMNGLAAQVGSAVRTDDYMVDPRIPHEPDDQAVAQRLGLRGMAVAPLRAVEGEVIGTLAVSFTRPRSVSDEELELLQGLADQAAIAVSNSRLLSELERSRERYRYLLKHSPDVTFSVDGEGRFTFLSDTIETLTGWKPEEMLGQHFSVLTMPEHVESLARVWQQMSRPPYGEVRVRFSIPHRDGYGVPIELIAVPIVEDGRFAGAHGASRDMRQQERLEQDLSRQAAELAAAEERAHLARELHDSVTQALFSMTLTTRTIELLIERDPAAASARLAELRELERDALAEMRALIFELRPGNLEHDGLVQALRTHAAGIEGRTGLPVTVEADAIDRLDPAHENALFRIAQEAVHNVVKHASARNLRIRLDRHEGWVRLAVQDDGTGFDPAAIPAGHVGLAGMRTRAERLGGSFHVDSARGAGTRIEVQVPYVARGDEVPISAG